MPRRPAPPPESDSTPSRRRLEPRRLAPFAFAAGVLALWGILLATLTPELFQRFRPSTGMPASSVTQELAGIITRVDAELAKTLIAVAPGVRPVSQQTELEVLHGVRWRSTRLEVLLPAPVPVEKAQAALEALRFDEAWQVRFTAFRLEPLSVTLLVSVRGYPTHRLTLHPTLPQAPPPDPELDQRVRIALLIDDVGQDRGALDPLWGLEAPFSVAILPYTPHALTLSQEAYTRGKEILVHLPMEPLPRPTGEPQPAAVGQLTLAMSPTELESRTRKLVRAVPFAVGANNHQGSAFTRDSERMRAVLSVLKAENMYFVDSRTIAESVGFREARALGVPAAERQVFLDTERSEAGIRQALGRLKATALKRGGALGIAHPYPETVRVLAEWLTQAEAEGFDLVPVSTLLQE